MNALSSANTSLQDELFVVTQQSYFNVMLPPIEFEKAEEYLRHLASVNAGDLEPEHHLKSFSTDELREVVRYADDWSIEDVEHARSILLEKGIHTTKQELAFTRESRLDSLRNPANRQWTMIVLGYFFAFIGGILGIILGLILNTQKKMLPNGEKVYCYDQRDRRHGFNIFVLAVFILIGLIIIRIF